MDVLNGTIVFCMLPPAVLTVELRGRFHFNVSLLVAGHFYWLEPEHAFETFREYEVGLIALSILQGSFAYGGWNFLNYVTEELVDPAR